MLSPTIFKCWVHFSKQTESCLSWKQNKMRNIKCRNKIKRKANLLNSNQDQNYPLRPEFFFNQGRSILNVNKLLVTKGVSFLLRSYKDQPKLSQNYKYLAFLTKFCAPTTFVIRCLIPADLFWKLSSLSFFQVFSFGRNWFTKIEAKLFFAKNGHFYLWWPMVIS